MNIKRFISYAMALCLAFSVSTAMAAKSSKSDKGSSYSQKHDHRKGKRGGKSEKSAKSSKSQKSGKSMKPTACFTSYAPSYIDAVLVGGVTFYNSGSLDGLVCSTAEWETAVNELYGAEIDPDLQCTVDLIDETIPVVGPEGLAISFGLSCSYPVPGGI